MVEQTTPSTTRSLRGFAAMDAAQQREIASRGGKAAHAKGTAHEFTSEEAAAAGRKGALARSQNSAMKSAQAQVQRPQPQI
jgi:general stress protein YciG